MKAEVRSLERIITVPVLSEETGIPVRKVIGAGTQQLFSQNHTGWRNLDSELHAGNSSNILPDLDPFIMLDHVGPFEYGPGEALGAPDHPHRGTEIISLIEEGFIEHADSLGHCSRLGPGCIQWLSCGSGLVHYEMPDRSLHEHGGRMEAFQLWINVATANKMSVPCYKEVSAADVPRVHLEEMGAEIRVIAGNAFGISGCIESSQPILLLDVSVRAGCELSFELPSRYTTALVYAWRGDARLGAERRHLPLSSAALLSSGHTFQIHTDCQDFRALVLGGEKIHESMVRSGPFVMSTQEEIDQALSDYQAGRLGHLEGKDARLSQNEAAIQKLRSRMLDVERDAYHIIPN